MAVNKIYIFEKNNLISINVYSLNDKLELYPLRISNEKFECCINLLLINNENTNHYVLMKKLSPLIKKNKHCKMAVCPYCLQKFTTQEKLDMHKIDCINHTAVRIEFTDKEKLEFTNHQKQVKNPFVIYADFESTLEKKDTCQPNLVNHFLIKFKNIRPIVFVYILNAK